MMSEIHKSATISTTEIEPVKSHIGVSCLICGNPVECTENEERAMLYGRSIIKVCDDCRKAVEWAKTTREAIVWARGGEQD